jgi:hypothetical protein
MSNDINNPLTTSNSSTPRRKPQLWKHGQSRNYNREGVIEREVFGRLRYPGFTEAFSQFTDDELAAQALDNMVLGGPITYRGKPQPFPPLEEFAALFGKLRALHTGGGV